MLKKQHFNLYALFLISLAALALLIYLFLSRPFDIKTTIIDQITHQRIGLETDNQEINNLINNFILSNADQYEISEAPYDVLISDQTDGDLLYSEPLYLVVDHSALINNIGFNQINNVLSGLDVDSYRFNKIYVNQTDTQWLGAIVTDRSKVIEMDNYNSVINALAGDQEAFGLLPLSQLEISVKPLDIDGVSWTDTEHYPVQRHITISGHVNAVNQIKTYVENNLKPTKIETLLSVGDIQMGRYVGVKINSSGDAAHSFAYVKDILSQPDLTFAQLETPIAPSNLTSEGMILVAQPETVTGLVESGIDIVSLSSNHFGDAWDEGMLSSFQILDENKIIYIGAGRNLDEAWQPKFTTLDGKKIGFLSFVSIMPSSYGAGEEKSGTAWIDLSDNQDFNRVITAVQNAASQCDLLVTGFHWGTEYTPNPTDEQVKFAHAAVDAGSDLVVGTHPHVVQADEIYQGRYIIYSLGNFIMDQMWSEETREGALLYTYIYQNKIINTKLVPTQIMDYSQVRVMGEGEGNYILERIADAAQDLK